MGWQVAHTDAFELWWCLLDEETQTAVASYVQLLAEVGPGLRRPHADTLHHTNVKNLRELRIQHKGEPWRVLYAFDPTRSAILLVGGNKTGDKRWYDVNIPIAERLYAEHLASLEKQEKSNG